MPDACSMLMEPHGYDEECSMLMEPQGHTNGCLMLIARNLLGLLLMGTQGYNKYLLRFAEELLMGTQGHK